MTKYKSVQSIRPIFYVTNLIATAPYYHLSSENCRIQRWHAIYSATVLAILLVTCAWSIQGRVRFTYTVMTVSSIIVDFLSLIAIHLLNSLTIVKLVLCPNNAFRRFLRALKTFDADCRIPVVDGVSKRFVWEFAAYQLYFAAFCLVDATFWLTSYEVRFWRYYALRYLHYYQFVTSAFLIMQFAKLLADRFRYVNDLLAASGRSPNDGNSTILVACNDGKKAKPFVDHDVVKRVHRFCTQLTDIVDAFNAVFGVIFLSFALVCVVGLLEPLNLMMSFAISTGSIVNLPGGPQLFATMALWASVFLVTTVMLAASCQSLKDEARRTVVVCHTLIERLNQDDRQERVQSSLTLLAQQVAQNPPEVSAAGFFAVNYTLLLNVFGSVATQLIVLLQLNLNE